MISIFQSQNIRVDQINDFGSQVCLVSFTERKTYQADLAEQGFGQDFARKNSIDGFYVKCIGNHWYQYHEMPEAVAAIRKAAAGRDLVTYGSSMGAYAAIKFAGALGAKRAIAVSPLFSADPSKPPFERRWKSDADQIVFIDDTMRQAPETQIFVLTDPCHADAKHAKLFRTAFPKCKIIAAPFASHPVGHFLREAGLLGDVIVNLLFDKFDNRSWCTARRGARTKSEIYRRRLEEVLKLRRPVATAVNHQ